MKKARKWLAGLLCLGLLGSAIVTCNPETMAAASYGWQHDSKGWWYSYGNGNYPKNQWKGLEGKWYYFNKWGYMQTGWKKISGKWYYFGKNGAMRTNWQKISGKWYYFGGGGDMKTGMVLINNKPYTFDSNGVWLGEESGGSSFKSFNTAQVGDFVTLGHYEQDNNLSNGKEEIIWKVLDRKSDGSLLLLSLYALDCQPCNTGDSYDNWETSTIRKWLNEAFMKTAFSKDEQALILLSTLENVDNPITKASGGNTTKDKVFLLDSADTYKYFETDKRDLASFYNTSRACIPTAYTEKQGCYVFRMAGETRYNGCCSWWLRNTCGPGYTAAYVQYTGATLSVGRNLAFSTNTIGIGVRPAIWVHP